MRTSPALAQRKATLATLFAIADPRVARAFGFHYRLQDPGRFYRPITVATVTAPPQDVSYGAAKSCPSSPCSPLLSQGVLTSFDGPSNALDRRSAMRRVAQSCLGVGAVLVPHPYNPPARANDDDDGAPPSLFLAQPMGPPGSEARPSAPLEYLLPATRVRVYVDRAAEVAGELVRLQSIGLTVAENDGRMADAAEQLDRLLRTPPPFVRPQDPKKRLDTYSGGILGEWGLARQKQKEREERQIEVGLAPRALEVFELSGERRQWNRLQKQERAREDASEIRRAFNIYTSNLAFGEKYKLKASREERSRLIRSDRLPTVTSVIRSDLDLRDLYRNQAQTAVEDAQAEYQFQVKRANSGESKFDGTELLSLLKDAQEACQKWFSFIPEKDVREALKVVLRE